MKKIHLASIDRSLARIADALTDEAEDAPGPMKVQRWPVRMIVLSDEDYKAYAEHLDVDGRVRVGEVVTGLAWCGVPVESMSSVTLDGKALAEEQKENAKLRAMLEVGAPGLFEHAIKSGKIRP